jgi:hypothetical protein
MIGMLCAIESFCRLSQDAVFSFAFIRDQMKSTEATGLTFFRQTWLTSRTGRSALCEVVARYFATIGEILEGGVDQCCLVFDF